MDGDAPPRIRALESDVTNRIAAGEIIQRPANAVKELLDNSVDAGATSISVLVQDGGLKLLQVQDNGCGVHLDDLPILCRRHTTSKLTSFEDLRSLQTLGFRGEALASLSYVSLLTVTTKRKADEYAWQATFDSAEIQAGAAPCAGVDGTTVTVEDLFYNVPMRRKTLKNAAEEYNGLLDVVQRYAVYHAGIAFTLRRAQTKTPRADVHTQQGISRADAIRHVYGRDISSNLAAFERRSTDEETSGRIRLEGLLTTGGYTSAKKTKLLLFVNGRCVESPKIRRCVESVYGVLLPKGVKPFVFLSITMPFEWVDVNVHPTKTAVAMLHEDIVCHLVRQGVEEILLANEDSRTMDARVQTTLVPSGAAFTTSQTTVTNKTTQTTQTTQATTRPDKLVRVDAQSRTLKQMLSAPSRRNHDRSRERSSAAFDLAGGVHEGLQEILKENVVIGWVDRERILIQKATKLYLLDVGLLSRDLFVQRMLRGGRRPSDRLTLRPPPSVTELLLISLSSRADDTGADDTGADDTCADPAINEEVAGLLCELLSKHSEWLEATFGLVVSGSGEQLVQLPDPGLGDGCSPMDASLLPDLLLRLAAEVGWTEEGSRRVGVADALADLYRLREGDDERRSEAVWESVKSSLAPHRSRATDGSVVELTRLEKLYRTFERC